MSEINSVLDVSDVFFESSERPTFNVSNLLYCIEPRGIGTGLCESLKSYIYRLADEHRVSSLLLYDEVIKEFLSERNNAWETRIITLSKNGAFISPSPITKNIVEILSCLTGMGGLECCTMQPLKNIVANRNLIYYESERHCPLCFQEKKEFYELYTPLLWQFGCISVCPIHRIRLVLSKCGKESKQHLPSAYRKIYPGVCSKCGSIGYRCIDETLIAASETEVWRSLQVSKMIEQFPHMHGSLTRQNLIDGINKLICMYFNGVKKIVSQRTGIDTASITHWSLGRNAPNLDHLLTICQTASVSLVSLINGAPVECDSPVIDINTVKEYKNCISCDKLTQLLLSELQRTTPLSLKAISKNIRVSQPTMTSKLPDLTSMIVDRFKVHRAMEIQLRQDSERQLVKETIDSLIANKLPVTGRMFRTITGRTLHTSGNLRKFFLEEVELLKAS